jgi:CRP-like cAMP-binding protein
MLSATSSCSTAGLNQLLSDLDAEEYQRLAPSLRLVTLSLGEVIHESGELQESIYFPTTSVISLVYTTVSGATAEIGVIGNDGMVGVASLLGSASVPHRAVTLIAGQAFTARVTTIQNAFLEGYRWQQSVLRYVQSLLTQVSQTAVCNRVHSIEQRLCRWLLMCRDRTHSDDLKMTQEFISHMLGGRRESVTVAAGRLQDAGIIRYARGRIRILDLERLEQIACECHRIVSEQCSQLQATRKKPVDSFSISHQTAKKHP